jgi:ABC-2 type transport system permease protein
MKWYIIILLGINFLANIFHTRVDLTREKRYTLSPATKKLVKNLDEVVDIEVFLKGEFPSGFRKLANTTREFLRVLKENNSSKIRFRFVAPTEKMEDGKTVYGDTLVSMGAVPINLTVQKEASQSSNIIFPVAVIHYKGRSLIVNLYPGASSRISQEEINSAEALMEYQFLKTLDKATNNNRPGVGYSIGNGEPVDHRTYDLRTTLESDYDLRVLDIHSLSRIPDSVDVLLIVKPTQKFTEEEKFKIDQFVMRGGKLLFFIDNLYAEQDSLAIKPETIAYDRDLNLTDLFFTYGLRINTDLVMDLQCDVIPFVVGGTNDNPQVEYLQWNYYPFLLTAGRIAKGLGYVCSHFANSIDTIRTPGIKKEPLLVSSPNSRIISTPALISLNENKNVPQDEKFKRNAIPVAMLLEGKFTSLYRNRVMQSQLDSLRVAGQTYQETSPANKVIIVGDGDIVLNDFLPPSEANTAPQPLPMGWNKYTYSEYQRGTQFAQLFVPAANREFFLNCIEYLVSNPAISETRNKDIVLRLLDSRKVTANKMKWQMINILVPILFFILLGWFYQEARKRKYAKS